MYLRFVKQCRGSNNQNPHEVQSKYSHVFLSMLLVPKQIYVRKHRCSLCRLQAYCWA